MSFWHVYMGIYGGGRLATEIFLPEEGSFSIYDRILIEVRDAVRGLALEDIESENIQIAKVRSERETILPGLPGILIVPFGSENILVNGGTNTRDDIGYPVGIFMFDAERQDTSTGLPDGAATGTQDQEFRYNEKLLWRETIVRKFHNRPITLTGYSVDVSIIHVEPREIISPSDWLTSNIWASGLILRCWTRESRAA